MIDKQPLINGEMQIFMREALKQAKQAGKKGEVPVGAVIVQNHRIIAGGHNQTAELQDPTAHAEVQAIRKAAKVLGSWRLLDCTIFVTAEPCTMCMGAILNARIPVLVYGADQPEMGAVSSAFSTGLEKQAEGSIEILGGICEEPCRIILKEFFKNRRSINNKK
jgi:tRNA(adenine34) deaminase